MVGTWGDVGGLMGCLLAGSWRAWSYGFGLGGWVLRVMLEVMLDVMLEVMLGCPFASF